MINLISLGAGVQSSTMALMAAHGEITPMPDGCVFADTGAEPTEVYRHLDALEKLLPFPVHRVSAGDLAETSLRVRTSKKTGDTYLSHNIPAYTRNSDGSLGNYRRQCTDKHKIVPLIKKIHELRGESDCTLWFGISADEIQRMRISQQKGIEHRWPLIELRMTRGHCLQWMADRGYPQPPRSACVFCPYHSNAEWRRLRDEDPAGFAAAVAYEGLLQQAAQNIPRLDGIPFLHASRVPLSEADLTDPHKDQSTFSFMDECEGMCGV